MNTIQLEFNVMKNDLAIAQTALTSYQQDISDGKILSNNQMMYYWAVRNVWSFIPNMVNNLKSWVDDHKTDDHPCAGILRQCNRDLRRRHQLTILNNRLVKIVSGATNQASDDEIVLNQMQYGHFNDDDRVKARQLIKELLLLIAYIGADVDFLASAMRRVQNQETDEEINKDIKHASSNDAHFDFGYDHPAQFPSLKGDFDGNVDLPQSVNVDQLDPGLAEDFKKDYQDETCQDSCPSEDNEDLSGIMEDNNGNNDLEEYEKRMRTKSSMKLRNDYLEAWRDKFGLDHTKQLKDAGNHLCNPNDINSVWNDGIL